MSGPIKEEWDIHTACLSVFKSVLLSAYQSVCRLFVQDTWHKRKKKKAATPYEVGTENEF